MAESIPSENDLIVIGTGLTESIIAAAASRIGKKVLHLDNRDYYGSNWATFSFGNLQNVLHLNDCQEKLQGKISTESSSSDLLLNAGSMCFQNVREQWFCAEEISSNPDSKIDLPDQQPFPKQWTKTELIKESRKFNFDLAPKVLYSRGDMVEVLISSGICRYAEFKTVSSIHTYDVSEKRLLSVPCSRADVFSSKDISMIEKRLLMKALSMCSDYEKKPEDFQEQRSFGDFLSSQKIQGKIRRYIMDSVAMATEESDFCTAAKSTQKFVRSTGRYGNTPFLWTLYGSGELPQCFCRCSAVFGGIYCLKRWTDKIVVGSDGLAVGVYSENELLKAPYIVVEDSLHPKATAKAGTSRAILLTDKGLIGEHVALINFSSCTPGKGPVTILELTSSAMACPPGLFVVHLTTKQATTAEEDLKEAIDALFFSGEDRPHVLWSLHFNVNLYDWQASNEQPSNVFCSPGPNSDLDCDAYVLKAKEIFNSIFPGEEFLPRVPDPEDIILEDPSEDQTTEKET